MPPRLRGPFVVVQTCLRTEVPLCTNYRWVVTLSPAKEWGINHAKEGMEQ